MSQELQLCHKNSSYATNMNFVLQIAALLSDDENLKLVGWFLIKLQCLCLHYMMHAVCHTLPS